MVPASIMPAYPWLAVNPAPARDIAQRMRALQRLGHPYSERDIYFAPDRLEGKSELDVLVAYLQTLGKNPQSTDTAAR